MPRLGSDDIPPEIWLQIASYMSMVDIRRVVTLNRTFTALVAEYRKEQRSRLVLNTNYEHYIQHYTLSKGDWKTIAFNITKRLQERVKFNSAQHIKHIIFCSYPMPTTGSRRSKFKDFSVSVGGVSRRLLLTGRLKSTYKKFNNVESLTLLHVDSENWQGPQCLNYLDTKAMWTSWSANLRELDISVDAGTPLRFMVPPDKCQIHIPRLEVMRFAYMRNFLSQDGVGCAALYIVARLYTPATATLHTLELRFKAYACHRPPIAETLLPSGVVFSKLRHFAFDVDQYPALTMSDELANVTRFVRNHSNTLRKLQLGPLPVVFNSLIDDTPLAFSNHIDEMPPVSLSIRATRGSRILDPTLGGESLWSLRYCIVALNISTAPGNARNDWSYLSLLGSLRKLSLSWNNYNLSLASLVELAYYAPRIISLNIKHEVGERWLRAGLQGDNLRPALLESLKLWKLKDLGFYQDHHHEFRPTWWYLRHMATLIPSIESYFGRGHMEETTGKLWERSWVWRKNKYVDEGLGL